MNYYRIVVADFHGKPVGTLLGRHKKREAAVDKCASSAEMVIESEQPLTEKCYPELAQKALEDREHEISIHHMGDILDLAPGEELPGYIAGHIERLGLTLEQFREKYEADVLAKREQREATEREFAERMARERAIQEEFDAAEVMFTFPAVRGVQAGAYYTAQVPFRVLTKLFPLDDEEVPPELRAQRHLDEKRAKAIADYIYDNPHTYVLPALTASVSSAMKFAPSVEGSNVGALSIPMSATMLINDGQHRRRGIELVIGRPRIGLESPICFKDHTVAVVFFYDEGLERSQQIFADINAKAVKPNNAINALYDHRNPVNQAVLDVLGQLPLFDARVDKERGSVGAKSLKLWSLVSFKKFFLRVSGCGETKFIERHGHDYGHIEGFVTTALEQCAEVIPHWQEALENSSAAITVRETYITGHAVFLEALGIALGHLLKQINEIPGSELVADGNRINTRIARAVKGLSDLPAEKDDPTWAGRCVVGERMQKTSDGVKSTAAVIERYMGMEPTEDLLEVERRLGLNMDAQDLIAANG